MNNNKTSYSLKYKNVYQKLVKNPGEFSKTYHYERIDIMSTPIRIATTILSIIFFISISFAQQKIKTEANSDIINYTNKEGLPSTNISKVVHTRDGYIWISGIEGTYRFNGYEFTEVGEEFGIHKMQNVYYDSAKNIIYFASPSKFATFDGKNFRTYGKDEGYSINGLPGQVISFIDADSKGRIWIGSETPFIDKKNNGGLTKFENGKFTVYDSSNFPLDNATGFIETPYGDLIFSSSGRNTQTGEGAYVALYKNNLFKKIDESSGITLQRANILPQHLISSVDKEGNTWIAFAGATRGIKIDEKSSGVLMYDGTRFYQYQDFLNLFEEEQFPILVHYSKTLDKILLSTAVFGTSISSALTLDKNYIFEFYNGKWIPTNLSQEILKAFYSSSDNSINNFRFTSAVVLKESKFLPEIIILQTIGESQSQSSKYSDQIFTYKNGKWEKYDSFTALPGGESKDGLILRTSNGLGFYYPNSSRMLTAKDGLLQVQGGIPILFTDKKGLVWFSYSFSNNPAYATSYNTGINIWDGKKLRSFTEKDGLAGNTTFNFYQDSKERIWIATSKGITTAQEIMNSTGEQIIKFKNISSEKRKIYNTSSVMETSKGEIYAWQNYVRPESQQLIKADFYFGRFDGDKFVELNSPFNPAESNTAYQYYDLREDNEGRLWFSGIFSNEISGLSSVNSRILIYDGKNWQPPPKEWNVPNEQLHYVGKLKNGIYFLTSGKFFVFNGKNFVHLSDSVDSKADFRILKEASVAGTNTNIQAGDYLYIRLRNRGLVIFDGINLKFYTKKDGLPSTNLSNPMVDSRGNVFFGFPSGALKITGDKFQPYYDDENVVTGGAYSSIQDGFGNLVMLYNGVGVYINRKENINYPLNLSSVSVNNKLFYYSYPEELNYSQNSLVFNYAALNYRDPRQTMYEHFLEGYDKEWSRPSNLAFTEYQNLPPGKYRFLVRGITSNGMKTNQASYEFVINPPFWKTWWAYTSYFIFFGFILLGVRKYEKGKMLKRERAASILKEAELRAQIAEAESARKTLELEEARNLQLSMLPKEIPQLPHLDIAVYMKTATEVGGDYYDFHVHPDGTLTVILGDATGHGMMSGMMVSIMKSLFMSDRSNKELKPFFENASTAIKDMQLSRLMMALACVQIRNDKVITANAGMPPLIVYKKNHQVVEEIAIHNMPLGAMREVDYDVHEFRIERGDTLLMMTDGFAELKNQNEELYSYRRARNTFEQIAGLEPEAIVNHLKDEGRRWTNDKDPEDDVTFVVIKVK